MSAGTTDWVAWHDAYGDPASALSRRLRVVQDQIRRALPAQPGRPVRVLSMCAGRGADLIEVLSTYPSARQVQARLVEQDPRNVAAMSASARTAGLDLEIVEGDAAEPRAYEGAVPADLVLLCGILGNISDADARFTIASLPQLCRTGATVVWTRSRRPPDRVPHVRRWFTESGFAEIAFVAPEDALFSVGSCRFVGRSQPLGSRRFFAFACSEEKRRRQPFAGPRLVRRRAAIGNQYAAVVGCRFFRPYRRRPGEMHEH